jgi:hypothetical protein
MVLTEVVFALFGLVNGESELSRGNHHCIENLVFPPLENGKVTGIPLLIDL